jgi:Asp-tRNA(Asn)/Glu-tRNA(Gln) amidotransferase A subunit family amidase
MVTRAKKRRQQRAQSRLALARHKQQERARRQAAAAQRAEHQWQKTLRQLAALGATLQEDGVSTDGNGHPAYRVAFEGSTYRCRSRLHVQRWLKRTQRRLEEQNMSRAERHVQWMIEHNCDDFGNPWPE